MENKDELAKYIHLSIIHEALVPDEQDIKQYLDEYEEGWRINEEETHFIRPDGELLRIVK